MESRAVVERLKEFRQRRDGSDWRELDEDTQRLVKDNPFAFLIAVAFDRNFASQEGQEDK